VSRRQLLALGAAMPLIACRARRHAPVDSGAAPPLPTSTPGTHLAALGALAEAILPSDDGPGAREAGVVDFLARQLATPYFAPFADNLYDLGRALDEWAQARGHPFAALDVATRQQAVAKLATGTLGLEGISEVELFEMIHSLTLEGFLADPRHGGNRGQVGWRSIGFVAPDGDHHHLPVVK
jgi:gluconate 2-dehydrogenase gamma chain